MMKAAIADGELATYFVVQQLSAPIYRSLSFNDAQLTSPDRASQRYIASKPHEG